MKATYRPFSTHPLLNAIALLFFLTALAIIGWGVMILFPHHSSYNTSENIVFLLALLWVLPMNIWLLSSSILPIVKINSKGFTAYSIFWKRTIAWDDLRSVKLLKVKNRYARYGTFIEFEITRSPEKQRIGVRNKGYAVNTFIIVSDKIWHKPQNRLIRRGLYNHLIIAGQHAIAFEYNQHAWEMINNKRL
jgi:hypothetical protein